MILITSRSLIITCFFLFIFYQQVSRGCQSPSQSSPFCPEGSAFLNISIPSYSIWCFNNVFNNFPVRKIWGLFSCVFCIFDPSVLSSFLWNLHKAVCCSNALWMALPCFQCSITYELKVIMISVCSLICRNGQSWFIYPPLLYVWCL